MEVPTNPPPLHQGRQPRITTITMTTTQTAAVFAEQTAAKPPSLYEATTLLEQLDALMDAEELDEVALAEVAQQYLEASGAATAAIERYCFVIQKREKTFAVRDAEAKAQNAIARGLRALANRDETLIKRLKRSILAFLDDRGIPKIETDHFEVRTQNSGGKPALILDEDNLPSDEELATHFPHLCSLVLDERKVRDFLEQQETPELRRPDGSLLASLVRGRQLRLKPSAMPQ